MNRKRTFLMVIPLSLLLLTFSLFFSAAVEAQESQPGGGFIGAETCIECHEDQYESYARSIHSRESIKGPQSQDACETCHGAGALHVEKGGGRDVNIFTFDADVDPEARSAKCLTCHQTSEGMDLWNHSAHSRNEVSCDGCHDLHVEGVQKPSEPEVCFDCHRDIRVQVSKRSHHPILEGKVNCSSCHEPHGSISRNLVKADDTQQLCHSCHTDKRGPYIYEHPPVEENCLTCHTSHGSRHIRLLSEKVPNICQDCHNWSRHPGTPYDADTGFIGDSPSNRFYARSCLNCHGTIHGSNTFENHRLTR